MMRTKKDEAKFTIKFNLVNPRHREAVRILNEAGRGKAALIAEALYTYAHHGAGKGVGLPSASSGGIKEELAPDLQDAETYEVSEVSESDDGTLLNTLADSVGMFFDDSN